MKPLAIFLMLGNAALFFFGAMQHAGVALGPFHEPRITPAAVVETTCGIALLWGVTAIARGTARWQGLAANFVAIAGLLLGMAALAAGRGPRTASNDMYHHIMLVLAGASVVVLLIRRR